MPGTLLIVSCSEDDQRLNLPKYFNFDSTSRTSVIKTTGGRAKDAIPRLKAYDSADPIGMIVLVQHTACQHVTGDVDANIRVDTQELKTSPDIRKGIPIIGFKLDLSTCQLQEVSPLGTAQQDAARQEVLNALDDFCPFFS
ncbi:hypothetical protein BS50DRAFT_186723 [Corynespora cassiicola Philippines]|uniref:Carbonic anhydrase n=1 Tax=Corynespora cassiicola Philippines TaxID=1448308 RepID=A0A2T2P6W2_CORCC|nr:hypothetical protein BS50DRAFT_186723 [Corynespora cassiicola Philippines]